MSKSFDRIVGPEGEWEDAENDEGGTISERDEFIARCLNASVNLYGIVTAKEFCEIYNGYAKDHDAPLSEPLDEDEALSAANRILHVLAEKEEKDWLDVLDLDAWFTPWHDDAADEWLFVYEHLTDALTDLCEEDADAAEISQAKQDVMRAISRNRARFIDVPLKILPEETFLCYDDPMGDDETSESKKLVRFIKREYGCTKDEAEFDVWGIVAHLRVNGATIGNALNHISEMCGFNPEDEDGMRRLMDALSPVVSTTRTWEYRGHTQREMVEMGKIDRFAREDIPNYSDLFGDGGERDEEDYEDDNDDYDEGEPIRVEELPPAKFTGPFDFKSVKDQTVRDKLLYDYEGARIVTREFVRDVVIREMTEAERRNAAKRLGFAVDPKTGRLANLSLDMVAGDFGSMMDDQGGEPAIKRVLKRRDKLSEIDRAAAAYYDNYRYTWLEVLAAKSGVGLKCRDLMTGEDLFLMETSLSRCDVRGMTICVGIAPIGPVYMALGVVHPTNFDNPATILKIVLAHLGIPSELPVKLSFADQARFAAETIRRINANGKFDNVIYGANDPER